MDSRKSNKTVHDHWAGASVVVALAALLAPGICEASFVNYKTKEINIKVVYFGPSQKACAYNLDNLLAHAKQKTKQVTARLRPGVVVRYFTLVPRDAAGKPYRYRRFLIRLWVHAVTGPARAEDLDLVFKGADAVVFVRPSATDADLVLKTRKALGRLLRKHRRQNAPVVRQWYGAANKDKKPGDAAARPGPLKARNEGVFATVRQMMDRIMMELSGKKKAR